MYLKTLGLHVFLAATKKFNLGNSKHIEANALALEALRSTLNTEYLMLVSNQDSTFAVWNTLTSSKLQTPTIVEEESSGESEQHCYMVQGNDSLEVYSETQLDDDDASSSSNDYIDANALNEELSIVCEKLLEKYNLLKKKSFGLNKENEDLISKLDLVLQESGDF